MVVGVALTPRLDISNEPRPEQGKTLTISYWWQNASAKVVEQNVTSRIEAAVSVVKGVEKVSSVSEFGSGRVTVPRLMSPWLSLRLHPFCDSFVRSYLNTCPSLWSAVVRWMHQGPMTMR